MRYRVKTTEKIARLASHRGHLQEGRGGGPQRIEHEAFAHRGGDFQLGPSREKQATPSASGRSAPAYRKRAKPHAPATNVERAATSGVPQEHTPPDVDNAVLDWQRPPRPLHSSGPQRPHLRFEKGKAAKPPAVGPEARSEALHADHGHLLVEERPALARQQSGQSPQLGPRRRLKRGPQNPGSMADIRVRGTATPPTAETLTLVPREHLQLETARRQQARPKFKHPKFGQGHRALTITGRSNTRKGSDSPNPPQNNFETDALEKAYSKRKSKFSNQVDEELSNLAKKSENTGLQAADKERLFVSHAAGKGLQWGREWNKGRDARVKLREAKTTMKTLMHGLHEKKYAPTDGRAPPTSVKLLTDGRPPPTKPKLQKKMLKRKQIRAFLDARLGAETTARIAKVVAVVSKAGGAVLRTAITLVGFPLLGVAVFVLLLLGLLFGGLMLLTSTTIIIASSYLADDAAIHDASLYATRLEAELEKEIQDIPNSWEWGHIDEFRYDLDPIGHEPLALMAYLTVKYQDFESFDIPYILRKIYDERYELTLDEDREERDSSYTDESGNEVPDSYTYYILNVTLRSKPLEDIIYSELDADPEGELWEWYEVLMETRGNHQWVANPFDFDWLPKRTSLYGYRIDPVAGRNLQTHRGLDIAMPTGTPIRAGMDGVVMAAVHNDAIFGHFVILLDEKGRELKYAHCHRLDVRVGEKVKVGTIIGIVGNTGASTGPHLHIEVKEKGHYRNPLFAVSYTTEEEEKP